MRGGVHACSWLPQAWIQVFFVSLVVLDPLVVVLAAFVRWEGIRLAAGVMVLDVAAYWIGDWPSLDEDPARLLRRVSLLPITLGSTSPSATGRTCAWACTWPGWRRECCSTRCLTACPGCA